MNSEGLESTTVAPEPIAAAIERTIEHVLSEYEIGGGILERELKRAVVEEVARQIGRST